MDKALKAAVSTHLRPRGFTGSLPHLRRIGAERVDLLSVQYFSSGGSFVVEVASCGPEGITTESGHHTPAERVTAHDIGPFLIEDGEVIRNDLRPRLGRSDFPAFGDHSFVFGPRNYEPGDSDMQPPKHYEAIAAEVVRLVEAQAEPFWQAWSPT